MAEQLVESLAGDFEPEKYHDEYREQVLDLIGKKAAGEELVVPEPAASTPKVVDLMAALEASVQAAKDEPHAPPDARTSRRRQEGRDGAPTTTPRRRRRRRGRRRRKSA